jgi:predicted metalloprotease with PDZ domain
VAEGFTEYYGTLIVRRAGLSTLDEYLGSTEKNNDSLSALIETLQKTPGRLEQPVASASYDAWIKLYRPDENSVNTSVSYYTKGAVVAWLLDAKIRRATRNLKSLDDVMRLAYERYSGPKGYTAAAFRKTAADVAGIDLEPWFHDVLETTAELDYSEALDWFGLRFRTPQPGGPRKAWLGMETRTTDGRLTVTRVPRETPAYQAGLSADDEILAIDDYRVRPDQWAQRMEQYRPGDRIAILVARRDRLVRLEAALADDPGRRWQLETRADATPEQRRNLVDWLGAK